MDNVEESVNTLKMLEALDQYGLITDVGRIIV